MFDESTFYIKYRNYEKAKKSSEPQSQDKKLTFLRWLLVVKNCCFLLLYLL